MTSQTDSPRLLFHQPQPSSPIHSLAEVTCHERSKSIGSLLTTSVRETTNRFRAKSSPTSSSGLHKSTYPCTYPFNLKNGLKLKVLVVDDNILNLRVIKKILVQKLSHLIDVDQLRLVSSGASALEYFNLGNGNEKILEQDTKRSGSLGNVIPPFDLVLLDISMPIVSGIDVCQRLRQRYEPDQLHICAVTTDIEIWQVEVYRRIRMNGVIGKPLKIQDLEYSLLQAYQNYSEQQFYYCFSGSLKRFLQPEAVFCSSPNDNPWTIENNSQMSGFEWARSCSSERNCRKISVVTGNASEAFSQRPGRLLRLDSNSSTRSFETDSSYPAEALSSATTIFFPNNLVTFDINKPAQKFLSAERNGQEDGLFELYKPRLREETDLAAEIEQERTDSCLRQAKVTCEFSSRPLEFSKGQSPSMEHIGVITDDEDTIHKRNNRYSNSVLKSWQSTRLKTSPV